MTNVVQTGREEVMQWVDSAIELLPNLLVAIIFLFITFFIARRARRLTYKKVRDSSIKNTLNKLISTTTYIAIVLLGGFVALEILQLDKAVTSLLAGVGILGLALAFAFQDIVANFVSGVIMAINETFKVGDLIETNDYFGTVQSIELRTTTINALSGQTVQIPNSDILSNAIVNYSEKGERRVDIECGVGYDDDLDLAESATRDVLENLPFVDGEKGVDFFYKEFGGSSVNFVARFWIDFDKSNRPFLEARSKAIKSLKQRLDDEGLDIPYPIRTIDLNDSAAAAVKGR